MVASRDEEKRLKKKGWDGRGWVGRYFGGGGGGGKSGVGCFFSSKRRMRVITARERERGLGKLDSGGRRFGNEAYTYR